MPTPQDTPQRVHIKRTLRHLLEFLGISECSGASTSDGQIRILREETYLVRVLRPKLNSVVGT